MKIPKIDIFRNVIERYNGQGLKADDIMLSRQADKFYVSKESAALEKIITDIEGKNTQKSIEFAAELQKLLQVLIPPGATTRPVPAAVPAITPESSKAPKPVVKDLRQAVLPPTAAVSTPPPPMPAVYAPPPNPQRNELETNGPKDVAVEDDKGQAEPAATAITSSAKITYIDPAAHLPIHPVAELMPCMNAEDLDALAENMKLGQREPVTMFAGQLIDGRHRALACQRLNVPIKAVEWDQSGTLEDFVIAKNVLRRQLTQAQRAAIAAAFLPELKKEAMARMTSGKSNPMEVLPQGTAADIAGKKLGVSGKSVSAAEKIKAGSEELFQQVLNGTLSIPQAQKQAEKQNVAPAQPERITFSVEEAVSRILLLVPEGDFKVLEDIYSSSPAVVRKAIRNRIDEGSTNNLQILPDLPLASGN